MQRAIKTNYSHIEHKLIRIKGVSRRLYKRICATCSKVEWVSTAALYKKRLHCSACTHKIPVPEERRKRISQTLRAKFKDNPSYKQMIQLINTAKAKKGKDHWNWKGGITSENQHGRNSEAAHTWRKLVYQRDMYHCRICQTNGELHAHHIVGWATDPELRYVVNNGITLCSACHDKIHLYFKEIGKNEQ